MKHEFLKRCTPATLMMVLFLGQPVTAFAYVGPGAGLSIIGSLLAFFAAIVIGIFGFLWFPIRRMLRKRKNKLAERNAEEATAVPEAATDNPGREQMKPSESDA